MDVDDRLYIYLRDWPSAEELRRILTSEDEEKPTTFSISGRRLSVKGEEAERMVREKILEDRHLRREVDELRKLVQVINNLEKKITDKLAEIEAAVKTGGILKGTCSVRKGTHT